MHIYPRPSAIKVMNLLARCSLLNQDISEKNLPHFFGCGAESSLRGVIGVELYGDVALLRSLAVDASVRGKGCGKRLVQQAEEHAARHGVKRVYLLTTTAETFFSALGYARADRDAVPGAIRGTSEFNGLCPASATVMAKDL